MQRNPLAPAAQQRVDIAQRVADAHRELDGGSLLSFVSRARPSTILSTHCRTST